MPKQPKVIHFHRLKLKNLRTDKTKEPYFIYFCTKPNCQFYIRHDLIWGKEVECNRCHQPFIIKRLNKIYVEPHCDGCTKKTERTKAKEKQVEAVMEDIMKDFGLVDLTKGLK